MDSGAAYFMLNASSEVWSPQIWTQLRKDFNTECTEVTENPEKSAVLIPSLNSVPLH